MKQGTLVLSLDFELVWGIFDHIKLEEKVTYFDNTLQVIPKILSSFEAHSVQATWATVGMLFNANWEEWMANRPEERPTYDNPLLDAYAYGEMHLKSGLDRFFFAPQLIKHIMQTPGQEMATHTYSHYYCGEKGQQVSQFKADLLQAKKMALQFGTSMDSLVFPRNQSHPDYLDTCWELGIQHVRTNPAAWYWANPKAGLPARVARTADAYLPFGVKSYAFQPNTTGLQQQPASRFLRPHHQVAILNTLRLQRIQSEMTYAAQHGEVYHLWWHPHNFGTYPQESMEALQVILATFKKLEATYGFQSKSMQQLGTSDV